MTVRINKQKINLREKLAGAEDKVNFDEVVRGLGENTAPLILNKDGGNVGIGTTNPGAKLDVNNNTATDNAWNILAKFRPDINDQPAEVGIHIQSYPSSTIVADRRAGIQSADDAGNAKPLLLNKDGGNVGIGTTSPSAKLEVSDSVNGGAAAIRIINRYAAADSTDETSDLEFWSGTNQQKHQIAKISSYKGGDYYSANDELHGGLTFWTQSSVSQPTINGYGERMRIDSAGNVGIGTTSPTNGKLEIHNPTTTVATTDSVDLAITQNASGTSSKVQLRAGVTSGDDPYFSIRTRNRNDASSEPGVVKERMRIDSNGNVGIGTTDPGTNRLQVLAGLNTQPLFVGSVGGSVCTMNRNTSDGHVLRFEKDGTLVGHISTNSNGLPSDKNFKRNITDLKLGLDFVNKLKPSVYNYKIDDEDCPVHYGLIAQDVESALEECGVEKNSSLMLQHSPTEKEEESDYSLDYGKLVPVLAKAIQEQQQLINDLKSRIETLEQQ